jgi:hypothetical protein
VSRAGGLPVTVIAVLARGRSQSAAMWSKKRPLLVVGVSVGVAAAAVLGLILIPVPQHFSILNADLPDHYVCSGIDTTVGTTIHFHWSAESLITFFAVSCSANEVAYTGNGSGGSGTIFSVGGAYDLGEGCPEGSCVPDDVSGTFTGPLLSL